MKTLPHVRRRMRLLTLAIVFAFAGCASLPAVLDPPAVSLSSIEIKELGLIEQQFLLKLRLQNPNRVPLPIAGMEYELTLNETKFARGLSNAAVTVPAQGEAVTDITVTSNLQSVLTQLGTFAVRGGTATYRVQGHVSVVNRALKLPFDYSGSVGLPAINP